MTEVLTTRQIVDRMLLNATVNKESVDYLRALADVVMYDDLHEKNRADLVTITKAQAELLNECLFTAWSEPADRGAEQDIDIMRVSHALGHQTDKQLAQFIKDRIAEEEEYN